MKMTTTKGIQYLFWGVSLVNVIFQVKFGINYLTYMLYVFIFLCLCVKQIDSREFLLYALFIPNKYLEILSIPIYLFFRKSLLRLKYSPKVLLFLLFVLLSGILNCFVYKGLLITTLFQVAFYYCVFSLAVEFQNELDIKKIVCFLDDIFILEILAAILDIVFTKNIGDNIRGTFESAHYFGVFLLIYLFMLYKVKNKHRKCLNIILRCISASVIFILADAKHVALVVVFSFVIVLFLNAVHLKQQLLVLATFLLVGTALFVTFAESDIGNALIQSHEARVYLYNEKYNKKYTYIANTYEEMDSINGLIGFGAGQYGSQISISMSKGMIYEWNPELSFYNYAIQPFKNAIGVLMT